MEGTMTFGERMKKARKAKGLTQDKLALLVGVSKMTIRRYEANQMPEAETILMRICKVLDMNSIDNCQDERSIPMCNNDKCEKKTEDMSFFLDGYIDEIKDDMVAVPRSEYDKLIANSIMLKVVERIINSKAFSTYSIGEYLKDILAINKPDPEPEIPSAPGPDEEDSE